MYVAGVLVVIACGQPPARSVEHRVSVAPVRAPLPNCRVPAPDGLLAQFPGEACGFALSQGSDGLTLESLDADKPFRAWGAAPDCRLAPCTYEGVHTTVGPLIVATQPGAESEVPTAVFLGYSAGTTLSFVDLWAGAGPTVREDVTSLGPGHGLAPVACGAALGLVAQARLPVGQGLELPEALIARQGVLDPTTGQWSSGPPVGCVELELPLP